MLIKKEHDYGIRIIRVLSKQEPATLDFISTTEDIKRPFVSKVAAKLRKAGLVTAKRGPVNPGYSLAVPLEEISLYDIIIAIDEDFHIVQCQKDPTPCLIDGGTRACTVHGHLGKIQDRVIGILKDTKLVDLFQ